MGRRQCRAYATVISHRHDAVSQSDSELSFYWGTKNTLKKI